MKWLGAFAVYCACVFILFSAIPSMPLVNVLFASFFVGVAYLVALGVIHEAILRGPLKH